MDVDDTTSGFGRTLMTAEQLLVMPDDHWRYELIAGELIRFRLGGPIHSLIEGQLMVSLFGYADRRRGVVFAPDTGFIIGRNPDTVVAPDLAYVRMERMPPRDEWDGYLELAPDFVLEVVGTWESRREVMNKVALYLAVGVKSIWVIEPDLRIVNVFGPGQTPWVATIDDTLDGELAMPDFSVSVASLFQVLNDWMID